MRVGVIGLGYWGSKHARVLSTLPGVDKLVVTDLDRDRREALARAFPSVLVAPDALDLLDVVDAVVVATHPSTHHELAEAALDRGKHVLVEKPLALDAGRAADLVRTARARSLVLMVGHTFAYNPAVLHLKELIALGELGDILHIDAQRLNLGQYQRDCDVIWDLAPHDISIINSLVGATPVSVSAWGRGHINPLVTDNAYILLNYAEAVQAVIHVSWLDPHKVRRTTVVGSRRMAVYDDLAEERIRVFDKGVDLRPTMTSHAAPLSYRYGDIHAPYISFDEPLLLEDEHFLDCVRSGRRPVTDGQAGVDVVRVLEAATEALLSGAQVPVGAGSTVTPSPGMIR